MNTHLTSFLSTPLAAVIGSVMLHAVIAGWMMLPALPTTVPQSQIIQISMVAPTTLQQAPEQPQTEIKKQPQSQTPPATKGTIRQTQKTEKRQESRKNLTSGPSHERATETLSALTKPVAADYLNNPPPRYPEKSRLRKQQGTVLLDVRVKTDGKPKSIHILRSSGYTLLDQAALDAVRQWIFTPAQRGNQQIEASVQVPVQFQLK